MQKLSSYVVASPIFSEDNAPLLVVLATRTGVVFELPLSIWQVLRSGAFEKLNAKTRTELSEAEILVPQAEDELAVVLSRNREAIRTNTHLNYVIQPTAHCQLGCATRIGNSTFGSDSNGNTFNSNQIGNSTFGSDSTGRTFNSSRIGNSTFGNDSDGNSWNSSTIGNTTIINRSDGTSVSCSRIGSQTICN